MIGIIGFGMVGQAVDQGFDCESIISDPAYNAVTVEDVCCANVEVIFICVPTPTDDSNYRLLRSILTQIKKTTYKGLIVVKSTILPEYLNEFDVVYNPEFLSRATAADDFVNPPMVILGGDPDKTQRLLDIYKQHSRVNLEQVFLTDIATAALTKYTMNAFYALKVTYMNAIYDIAHDLGADYAQMIDMLAQHPWMGTHHFQVPGPDGIRGFGGPCLPKDTQALSTKYNVELLTQVLNLNKNYRGSNDN